MWVSVAGPSGTSKNKILDYIESKGHPVYLPYGDPDSKKDLREWILQYQDMGEIISQEDTLSFSKGCQWDTLEVYAKALLELERIKKEDYDNYEYLCKGRNYFPDAVVYIMPDKKHDCYNRKLMRDQVLDQELLDKEIELYDSYVQKINVPVIEIIHFDVVDKVLLQMDYVIDSFKNQMREDSIWSKRYFKYGF